MMNKLTIFMLSTIISSFALADFEVPNQFEDGQVTSASQMNENFQALKVEIEALKSQLTSQADNQVNFIGYSEDSMNGGAGFFAMLQACENFASGSHVCNTDEFLGSQYSESAMSTVSGDAWILPSIVAAGSNGWSKFGVVLNNGNTYRNCYNWSQSRYDFYGSAILTGGVTSALSCNNVLKVACCK